jgi:hypothetical protein
LCAKRASPSKKPASEQDRADVARKRLFWRRYQGLVAASRLMFIDETWAKTNMTRTHGWAGCGRRLVAAAPHSRWTTMTFIAGLRTEGIVAPCVFDGPINGELFLAWVEQFPGPDVAPWRHRRSRQSWQPQRSRGSASHWSRRRALVVPAAV